MLVSDGNATQVSLSKRVFGLHVRVDTGRIGVPEVECNSFNRLASTNVCDLDSEKEGKAWLVFASVLSNQRAIGIWSFSQHEQMSESLEWYLQYGPSSPVGVRTQLELLPVLIISRAASRPSLSRPSLAAPRATCSSFFAMRTLSTSRLERSPQADRERRTCSSWERRKRA